MLPHHLRLRRVVLVIGAGSAIACASGGGTGSGNRAGADEAALAKHDRTLITAADMKDIPASNLFEIVQRIHPEWLTVRNSVSIGSRTASDQGIHVYIDSQRAGSTEILKQVSVSSAASLKFYSASEAQARFGNGNLSGVIQVISVMKR